LNVPVSTGSGAERGEGEGELCRSDFEAVFGEHAVIAGSSPATVGSTSTTYRTGT
jgi:hypothetical protein